MSDHYYKFDIRADRCVMYIQLKVNNQPPQGYKTYTLAANTSAVGMRLSSRLARISSNWRIDFSTSPVNSSMADKGGDPVAATEDCVEEDIVRGDIDILDTFDAK